MFIMVLFTIAKTWKQPQSSPTNKWIKKLWRYKYVCVYMFVCVFV